LQPVQNRVVHARRQSAELLAHDTFAVPWVSRQSLPETIDHRLRQVFVLRIRGRGDYPFKRRVVAAHLRHSFVLPCRSLLEQPVQVVIARRALEIGGHCRRIKRPIMPQRMGECGVASLRQAPRRQISTRRFPHTPPHQLAKRPAAAWLPQPRCTEAATEYWETC
jgi:hypothetical protein